ncbi:MAG: PstS family phosphate ABC transporter substrate-binding protein [Planctomycetota bacterium]
MNPLMRLCLGVVLAGGFMTGDARAQSLDPDLPVYEAAAGVDGTIKSIGSDTMNNLMTGWGDDFRAFYPAVKVEVEGKGSSTAPPALIQNQANFGPMSRPMKGKEIDAFQKQFGYEPTLLSTGIDALAVFVHKDCPLDEISLDDLEQVFSVNGPDMTWADLGVSDPAWRNEPISLYGRNSASGTYGFFKDNALAGSDFKSSVKEQAGSGGVIQAVGNERFAMGYSGIGYATANVKALRVSLDGIDAFEPTAENSLSGDYPLARFLFVYINKDPRQALDPLREQFIRLIFSRRGQDTVLKFNYIPVPADIAREQLEKLGLEPGF